MLKYLADVSELLMADDMEETSYMFQEPAAVHDLEKSFSEALAESPSVPDHFQNNHGQEYCSSSLAETSHILMEEPPNMFQETPGFQDVEISFYEALGETTPSVPDHFHQSPHLQENFSSSEVVPEHSKGKNHHLHDDLDVQGERRNKQLAISIESNISEMFDKVLLSTEKNESALRKALQNGRTLQHGESNGSSGKKSRSKKQGSRQNAADLRTLLTHCAQAVASGDQRTAVEYLKEIRVHSNVAGDEMQRLAHYCADGLVARMAAAGIEIYKVVVNMPTYATDLLKAHQLYLAICPFRKITDFFANQTIMNLSSKATKLHIIDFGIVYGFQWPRVIQGLSSRPNGPPKLRITGIDLPCSDCPPAERVEETGRRLARYAEIFNVPFEFNAIAQKWEAVKIEDLKLEKDEIVVVNGVYRFCHLLDETVMSDSPRNAVLNLIKKINPAVFVQGILNGAYNGDSFICRFREALFHFSSLFDMLEATTPRETHERMWIEKNAFGAMAQNVIACEGDKRVERPETYKQWQARNQRIGFKQFPLNKEIMDMATRQVREYYHKDFFIDKDGNWLLMGWKGRILYAVTSWKSAAS